MKSQSLPWPSTGWKKMPAGSSANKRMPLTMADAVWRICKAWLGLTPPLRHLAKMTAYRPQPPAHMMALAKPKSRLPVAKWLEALSPYTPSRVASRHPQRAGVSCSPRIR